MRHAPILVFTYCRPESAQRLLQSLSQCPGVERSCITIFSDGPKGATDRPLVEQVRATLAKQSFIPHAQVVELPHNRGLRASIVEETTRACDEHGAAIVLEDDLVVSRGFLTYINEALKRYSDDSRVMQVSGHSFPCASQLLPASGAAALLPATTTWGWATWRRAWRHYQAAPRDIDLLDFAPVRAAFELDGAYPYNRMLDQALAGDIDSWGIRWWWSVFLRGGLCVFPFPSLVSNTGVGPGSTHTTGSSRLFESDWQAVNKVVIWPQTNLVNEELWAAWKRCVALRSAPSLRGRLSKALPLRQLQQIVRGGS